MILQTLLSTAISGGVHYYVWRRIVRDPQWSPRVRRMATAVMVAMFIAVPITMWSARLGLAGLATALGWVAMPWMVAVGLTAVWRAAIDLLFVARALVGRLLERPTGRAQPGSARAVAGAPAAAEGSVGAAHESTTEQGALDRRVFLLRAASGTALVATAAGMSAGMAEALGEHEVTDVEIPLAKLPRALDGFTIVQLTDLHVGVTIDRAFVQRVVERTNALAPDLIALTGDLVDGKVAQLRGEAAPLGELRARHGVFAVTGNHEYYSGADEWISELSRLGVRYLRNQRVEITAGAAAFDLAGIDDHSADRWQGHGADLAAALRDRDPSRALVLLAHQPRQVRQAVQHGVDLQLSGHTHGGQVWPWHYVVRVQQGGLLAGRYQLGQTQLYVSRGCGYFGPPVRLGAPLEITRLVLRAAG